MSPATGRVSPATEPPLAERLRLMVVTRPRPACGEDLPAVVARCLAAGATAVELRDKEANGRELLAIARELREATRRAAALFIVNDRLDVAVAAEADGVHLGPGDLPVSAARAIAPPPFVIGYSTDGPDEGRRAASEGADYLGVGAVFGTSSKPGLEREEIGPERVREVLRAAGLPGVGIGGITPATAAAVATVGAGVAVLGAVMDATDPAAATRALRDAIDSARPAR